MAESFNQFSNPVMRVKAKDRDNKIDVFNQVLKLVREDKKLTIHCLYKGVTVIATYYTTLDDLIFQFENKRGKETCTH